MNHRWNRFPFVLSVIITSLIILYITVFSRYPSLVQSTQLIPFWSYIQILQMRRSPNGIVLNIALFIPFGWFLEAQYLRKKNLFVFLQPVLLSVIIEFVQYYTGRGTADIDDVISNSMGGAIGVVFFLGIENLSRDKIKHLIIPIVSVFLLVAEGIGACVTYRLPHLEYRVSGYNFVVEDVEWLNNTVTVRGLCSVYRSGAPHYQLLLSNGKKYKLNTVIDGERFIASGELESNKKYEVLIQFTGHETMSTGTFLNRDNIEFVAEELPVIIGIPENAILKAYNADYDTRIYHDGERLLWLIGTDIDPTTEIIYHIYTDEPQNLPEIRKRYGFDNRGFKAEKDGELMPINHYRVFEKEIPSEYHITEIIVGFSLGRKVIWESSFRVD